MTAFDVAAEKLINDPNVGKDATYTPAGGSPIPNLRIIIDRDVQRFPGGFNSQVSGRRTEVSFLASSGIAPKRGDTIDSESETFKVEGLEGNDGNFITVSVK